MNYTELLHAMVPEAALVVGALLVLTFDLTFGRRRSLDTRLHTSVVTGTVAVVAAMYGAFSVGLTDSVFGGVLVLDELTMATRLGVLMLSWLTLTLAGSTARLRHPAEFVAIVLLATSGFTLMAAAQQLLVAFVALELASLSLYILAGFDKTKPESAEAALKYFLFGGMSAAFLLFGFSLVYGLTGSIDLPVIAAHIARQGLNPLLSLALVMILVAFGFKAAAAPFHLWAPDVYEGAPVSSAALIASASKLAGFALFVRLLWPGFGPAAGSVSTATGSPGWLPVVACISAASLFLGNFAALAQSNVRRLLAYSAIAHAGVMLLGVMLLGVIAAGDAGLGPLFYYVFTYGIATVGSFGVIAVVERTGPCQKITDLAGLYRRSPLLTGCLAIYLLSLAGIPPLAGFFGKFTVFASALKLGGLAGPAGWLAIAAIALSAIALYYYLVVLKQALVAPPAANASTRIPVPADAAIVLVFAAALIVLLGLFPSFILRIF